MDLHVPPAKRELLEILLSQLRQVENLVAVVLGGSYASRTQHAESDLDIGLYYFEDRPFSIAAVRQIAESVAQDGRALVTDFYGWGAWVNGGAWIHTPHGKVDFIYRNVDQVQRTIADAARGISSHDYDQQPAYGFYSVIYLAETQICIPLYDPAGQVASLKRLVEIYPPALKRKVIADSLWSAEFTLLHARGFAAQGDIYNTVGCFTRAASNLTQALFALNNTYFIRDKRVMTVLGQFAMLPQGYVGELERILSHPGLSAMELGESLRALTLLWQSVVALPGVEYQPQFRL